MIPNIYIYKPYLFINSYGLAILCGILMFIALVKRDKRFSALITEEKFYNIISLSVFIGVSGARVFWAIDEWKSIENWYEILMIWKAGYYLFGSVIGIIVLVPIYLKRIKVPILPFLDMISIYVPLLQSISRIGCFLAGCCYGTPTNVPWAVVYINQDCLISEALRFVKIHPTQLYSSMLLLLIFFFIYFFVQVKVKLSGQIFATYIILMLFERFFHDYLRADREFFNASYLGIFSINQWIAMLILIITSFLLIYLYFSENRMRKMDYESF